MFRILFLFLTLTFSNQFTNDAAPMRGRSVSSQGRISQPAIQKIKEPPVDFPEPSCFGKKNDPNNPRYCY